MPRLLLLIAVVFIVWYSWQQIKKLPPQQRRRALRKWVLAGLIGAAFFLVATGRLHWVGAAIAAALPVIGKILQLGIRVLPMLGAWTRARGKQFPSRIKTSGLELTIDFSSGRIEGQVLTGPHAGQPLTALSDAQLQEQLAFFRENDRQSALLLNAFMAKAGRTGSFRDSESGTGAGASAGISSREEALQILGLQEGASREDILYAHKRLIQKLHPDRGGNDYLAAKVNAAKDTLLG